MFSRVVAAALRGGIRCTAAIKAPGVQNSGAFGGKSLVQMVKNDFTPIRSISSVVLKDWQSPKAPVGTSPNLLTKAIETNGLGGYMPSRTVIKYTMARGKRQTVKTVLRRFYRLNWGIWIRTKAGRHKRRWKKTAANARRSRQHVFCNATQSWLLDKMVSPYWRKPKYWVDDPYAPYHKREEFWATRTKPQV